MTIRQAAGVLGVTKYRVHAMIRQGQLTAEKRVSDVGTPYLVLQREDVERLADERRRIALGELPGRGTLPRMPPAKEQQ
jgi:excisionase family DNA binding protein